MRYAVRVVVLVLGILAAVQFFIPHGSARWVQARLVDWLTILEFAALIAGVCALARHHVRRIGVAGMSGKAYSGITLTGMGVMILFGLVLGTDNGSVFDALYVTVLQPIQASAMGLLGFYMASAVFRSFHLSSAPATILLLSAVIVILGNVPLGERLVPRVSLFATWIIQVPNVAATRGLWIGIGLAASATALRVILGLQGPASWKRR
jgi:hypothetical protein